mmetsp:Transcript_45320/g.94326  ORF Transcript_45320/g.94326 Transcript_45320/m.94326 type:complete len:213 (+) Transcript_45320:1391-2029(+)
MTYIYVKKDLTFIEDPASQSLLKAFLKAVYSDEFITQCEEEFGFVRVGGELREKALAAIDALVTDASAPTWTFETDTEKRIGQGDYVLSQKRKSYSEIEQEKLVESIGKLAAQLEILQAQAGSMSSSSGSSSSSKPVSPEAIKEIGSSSMNSFIDNEMDEDEQVKTALIMSSISIALWVIAILGMLVKSMTGGGSSAAQKGAPEDMMEAGVN